MTTYLCDQRADRSFDRSQGGRLERHFDAQVRPEAARGSELARISEVGREESALPSCYGLSSGLESHGGERIENLRPVRPALSTML